MNNQDSSNNTNRENENDFNLFNSISMETFIAKLKNEDQRYLQQVKSFKWIYIIFIIIYTLAYLLNPFKEVALYSRISGFLFIIEFGILYS